MDELKDHVSKLLHLLEDPHPGIFSWCEAYAEHMKWIVNYWTTH